MKIRKSKNYCQLNNIEKTHYKIVGIHLKLWVEKNMFLWNKFDI